MAAKGRTKEHSMALALCKHLSLDANKYLGGPDMVDKDTRSLPDIVKLFLAPEGNNDQVTKWIEFATGFPTDPRESFGVLNKLNEELITVSVLLGNGLKPSEADIIVFSAIHSSVIGLSKSDREKLPHVLRWMDYIQNKEDLGDIFEKISVEKASFEPQGARSVGKVEAASDSKATVQSRNKPETENTNKSNVKKASMSKEATQEKKKAPIAETAEKDKEASVSLLNIQVGLIRKAWKHPSADSLLVEEIDVGEAKLRQVVSGLAKYCSPEELTNRLVVLITNVKPGKLRDVMSEGLVLCASSEDHSTVEPLLPPEGAKPGERVSFSGIDGKPEDVLNPKKKQLEKITPHLFTDEKGIATFKGIPFMTSAGPCTSSIPKGTIK
ncbi:uncharacterized protein LOC107413994 isoform X2 [Ziziphus jujuba]|uniref:Uncharacterized protein LOC107413994 isoform X2 n=1 Tax=Ziziphus jujuba TaxID=326968 RepID=A0A6P6G155_ZIZJJ|nr:uncharacterized protein LOC107413994 isoform X2 [Ziziphus jujuba]